MWHMHQPDYRDASGVMQMPWVFLHSIKDYYDMPWMMARHAGIKATFNITSPIIKQLKLYCDEPLRYDRFLSLWIKKPHELNETQRAEVLKLCKSTQFDTMVTPFERYSELYRQEYLNNNEFIDIEILFMLSWCGVYLRKNSEVVRSLIERQKDFCNDDKVMLLEELVGFVGDIFGYYAKLHRDGVISLSTTPLNHPILPLLIDMDVALKANATTNIPKKHISLKEDAQEQILKAKEIFYDTFGFMPDGFWPAEGAVSEDTLAMFSSSGIKWCATDEEILLKSLHTKDRSNIYTPYEFNGVNIVFRDHYLSDLIGFRYRDKEPNDAASDFMYELERIRGDVGDEASVFVILDGENAWEFYKNNGYDFFDSLYERIKNTPWCKTLTMDEISQLERKKLPYLSAGSWIHGEFNTWVGHVEKTRAWELLYLTKRDYERHKDLLDSKIQEEIKTHFLAAECSDWFWWYGDDHMTEFAVEFDELFRNHLLSIYELMGLSAPADILMPILQERSVRDFHLKPQSDISPDINGKLDSFFEWIGCGVIDESKIFSTMDKVRGPITKIKYGQDNDNIYISFESKEPNFCKLYEMEILLEPINKKIRMFFDDIAKSCDGIEIRSVCKNLLEISIDKRDIDVDEISLRFEVIKDSRVIQTLPGFGELKLDLGNDYAQNWFI